MNKKFWFTVFTLIGTMVGAGILGLPYVFSRSGFIIGVFWLLFLGGILTYVKLCMGELTLRSKGVHQIPGYAKIYLGKKGKIIMLFAMVFGIYSALLAYLIGGGQGLSKLFMGNLNYSLIFALISWIILTLFLKKGLRGLKKLEFYGMLIVIILIFGIFIWFIPNMNYQNVSYVNNENFFLPFGVTLFALLGFSCIPELRREIKGDEKLLKKAIITGISISMALYFIFAFSFIGVLGSNIQEVATVSSGRFISLLGALTILTSYFVLSFALRDIFIFDFKTSKILSFILVSVIPLVLYLLVNFFKLDNFVRVIGIGGVVSGGLTGIMILIMRLKAEKIKPERKPEFKIPINWITVLTLSIIFILGCILEIFR